MHPFVLYLAASAIARNDRAAAEWNRRPRWASVDALPLNEPTPMPRRGRLTAIIRRRVFRAASA